MSPSLPLELRYLIIDEIWSSEPRGTTLSSLSLAWKDAIPFIRAHRFKSVEISSDKVLADFLDITDGAPEIFSVIHSMEIMFPFDHIGCNPVIHLISNAVNLEHLILRSFRMDRNYAEALRACARLTTLSLIHIHVKRVCDVFRVLSCMPHLTTLYLHWPHIGELMGQHRNVVRPPVDWLFEIPRPIPQISSLSLDIDSSEISLLDLISSSMTPFPELREISFGDVGIRGYGPHRLPALLVRYHSSLRVLDLRSELVMDLKILEFPPYVEHLMLHLAQAILRSSVIG